MSNANIQFAALLISLVLCVGCEKNTAGESRPETLEQAWQQYSFGAFEAALTSFQKIARHAPPQSGKHAQALYGEATVWDLRRPGNNPERARKIYQSVVDSFPNSEQAAWSALALVRLKVIVPVGQTPDPVAIRKAYQKVIDQNSGRMAAEEATILQQVSLIDTFRPAETRIAVASLEKFIADHPDSYYRPAAHALLANCQLVLGDPVKRLAQEILALETSENQIRAQWVKKHDTSSTFVNATTTAALFKIANIAEFEVGDFPTARKYYERFIRENPTEKRNFYARQALDRMNRTEAQIQVEDRPPAPAPNAS